MDENKKKLDETLEMFKPFLEGNNLSNEMSDYLKTVYFVPRKDMFFYDGKYKLSKPFDGTKTFPLSAHNTEGYFVAEFWFPYSNESIRKNCKYFMISHVFKLDFTHINMEVKRLSNGKFELGIEDLAYGIQEFYHLLHKYLLMENDKDDLNEIAKILYSNRIQIIASDYNV